ncbi:hypothetical protein AVEN_270452-1 [Araneus ventricosus]|uniref:Uncharacterized protein n=1 Tax=Araneus ventricosus TaxID=182803 RepID=A0A4Y2B7W7_ARAVE|nr:hypothetical protein AVEN_270452-1 [Araneus ventricosus]
MDTIIDSRKLFVIELLLFLVGVDITNKEKKSTFASKLAFVYQKFTVFWWIVYIIRFITTVIISNEIYPDKDMHSRFSRKFLEIIFILIWYVMMNRREKISVLLQEMEHILRRCNGKLPRLWMITSVTAIIIVHVVGSLIVTLPVTETHCQLMLKYQAFRLINVTRNNSCKIWYIVAPFTLILPYVLCTAIAILYIIFCCSFRNLLNAHSKSGFEQPYINCKDFRDYLLTCDSIVKGLKDFENVMSLPVLVVVVNNYTKPFWAVIRAPMA